MNIRQRKKKCICCKQPKEWEGISSDPVAAKKEKGGGRGKADTSHEPTCCLFLPLAAPSASSGQAPTHTKSP